MKKKLSLILSILILFYFISLSYGENKKLNIAVLEFDTKGDLNLKDAGKIVADWMTSSLSKTKVFNLKERILLKEILNEQKLSISGMIDPQTASKIGKIYGVNAFVAGSVIKFGDIISISIRMIDTETGDVIKADDAKMYNINDIPANIDNLALFIAGSEKKTLEEIKPSESSTIKYGNLEWEILSGTWRKGEDNSLYGSGGAILLNKRLKDSTIKLKAEHISGPTWSAAGIGSRYFVFQGGSKRFRDNSSDLEGFGFNLCFNGNYAVFDGQAGNWYAVNPAGKYEPSNLINNNTNFIELKSYGDEYTILLNNNLLGKYKNSSNMEGSVVIWVQESSHTVKFSNIEIIPSNDINPKTKTIENSGYFDFAGQKWEVLKGKWIITDTCLYGIGPNAAIITVKKFKNNTLKVKVSHINGPKWPAVGIGPRHTIFSGGNKLFKNNTSDNQGFSLNFAFNSSYAVFSGEAGSWLFLNPSGKFENSSLISSVENLFEIKSLNDEYTISVNNNFLGKYKNSTHMEGSCLLWVQDASQVIKFSNIEIY
ncbi:MAG: hypothetical protein HQK79_16120 [Desulfobacterales bacterium]|nr:hypothetical protein [Desulfobacterales bacterium]MBF0398860.1 hypothetical protein [Desulfobacterales bacterium]